MNYASVGFKWIYVVCPVCYLTHVPLSLLLPLLHVVQVLPLIDWHCALLLCAHVAAVGQSHAGHHGPSTDHGGGRHSSTHPWGKTLRSELHLRLAHVHACWSNTAAQV